MFKKTEKENPPARTNEKEASLFNLFFTKYTYVGFIFILFSAIITLIGDKVTNPLLLWPFNIFSDLLSTIGIALFIGAIFDMAKNSSAFVEMISKILSNIVISKTFLNTLSKEDKRQSLEIILKPSGNQLQQYSNIESYFQKKVDETTAMFDTNFKTNLNINVDIYINNEKNCLESKSVLSYRIYKINNKFLPIETWLEMPDSEIVSTKIYYGEKVKIINKDDMKPIPQEDSLSNTSYVKTYVEVPDEMHGAPYLTIQYEIIERGQDHWTNYHWSSLTPYDGINFFLSCKDNITIKEHFIFDNAKNYNVYLSEEKDEIRIISTIWLNQHSGFSITASKK